MAESMLAEAIESRDRVRAGSATAASELSSAQERLAKLTKLCDATQVALGDEQQRSRELELQLGAAQAQLTRLQRDSAASDELQAQLSLLREQLQAAQQPQPQPPPPPQQQATEEPSDGSLVARSSLDLCREVAHPAAQLRRVDVSGDRYEIESGITKVQQQYLHQRLFAPRLPAVVPSNLHANNASHLWAWQQAELRALDQRFPRLFAVLRLRDFCIAGRGGITAVAWDRERVLSGQLFEPMPPMSHGECVPLKRVRACSPLSLSLSLTHTLSRVLANTHRRVYARRGEQAIYAEFPWSNSFQHFVVDELPRLAPILWMMRDDPELKLIVQSSTIAADILSAFGVDMRDRLVPYRLSSVFCAHELLYPHGWPGGYTMEGRAAELVYLAHRQLFPVDLAPEQRTYIIYTSRPGTRARGATNQDDVIAEVQQWIKRHKRREQLKIWSDGTHSVRVMTVALDTTQHKTTQDTSESGAGRRCCAASDAILESRSRRRSNGGSRRESWWARMAVHWQTSCGCQPMTRRLWSRSARPASPASRGGAWRPECVCTTGRSW